MDTGRSARLLGGESDPARVIVSIARVAVIARPFD
jgi:hypothetical protein